MREHHPGDSEKDGGSRHGSDEGEVVGTGELRAVVDRIVAAGAHFMRGRREPQAQDATPAQQAHWDEGRREALRQRDAFDEEAGEGPNADADSSTVATDASDGRR